MFSVILVENLNYCGAVWSIQTKTLLNCNVLPSFSTCRPCRFVILFFCLCLISLIRAGCWRAWPKKKYFRDELDQKGRYNLCGNSSFKSACFVKQDIVTGSHYKGMKNFYRHWRNSWSGKINVLGMVASRAWRFSADLFFRDLCHAMLLIWA